MEIDPRRLAVLLGVHRAGGVVAAADLSRLTASAISQQIARLEAEVGMPVLDRQPTGAVLTAAGRVLAEAGERIEAELTEVRKALAALEGRVTGTVVVSAFPTVIESVLLPMLADLEEHLPGVDLVVHETDGTGMAELRAGTVDLLVLEADTPLGQGVPRGTRDVTILDEPWLVVLPAAVAAPATAADLAHTEWLSAHPTAAAHPATARLLGSLDSPTLSRHVYSDYDVALAMVAGGLGLALLPALAVRAYPQTDVQAVRLPGLGTRRVLARHRSSRTEPRQEVSAVLDAIVRAGTALEL